MFFRVIHDILKNCICNFHHYRSPGTCCWKCCQMHVPTSLWRHQSSLMTFRCRLWWFKTNQKSSLRRDKPTLRMGALCGRFFLCNHYSRYHIVIFLILLLICYRPRADGRNFPIASNRPFFPQFYVVIFKKKMCLYSPAFLFNQFSFGDNIRFYSKEKNKTQDWHSKFNHCIIYAYNI